MRPAPISVAAWILLAGVLAGPVSCARNPVTGKREIALVSESQEIQMGQQYAQQIVKSMGCTTTRRSRTTSPAWG
jgi:predicted Zn-dependent protease